MKHTRLPLVFFLILVLGLVASFRTESASAAPAQGLVVEQACGTDGRVDVTFFWTSSHTGIQWLDLSLYDNDFAPGTFLGAGSMSQSHQLLPLEWAAAGAAALRARQHLRRDGLGR